MSYLVQRGSPDGRSHVGLVPALGPVHLSQFSQVLTNVQWKAQPLHQHLPLHILQMTHHCPRWLPVLGFANLVDSNIHWAAMESEVLRWNHA